MANAFFDKLVQDRREGVAPPQVVDAEPEEAGSEPMIIFHPAPFDGLSVCGGPSGCHALLVTEHAPAHAQWHRNTGA